MSIQPDATLAEIQAFLGALVRRSDNLGASANVDAEAEIRMVIAGNDRLTPVQQAEIYREQFWLRHRDSLDEDFPALSSWLGQDAFECLARAYLAAIPPSSWTLRDLGVAWPAWLDQYEHFPSGLGPVARELAHLDLGFITAFDAPARVPVHAEKVATIAEDAWPDARILLQPSLRVFAFKHAVNGYRWAVRRGDIPGSLLPAKPTWIALYRGEDLRVHEAELAVGEHALLVQLAAGATLSYACEQANALDPEGVEAQLGGWLSHWARRGWVVDIVTKP